MQHRYIHIGTNDTMEDNLTTAGIKLNALLTTIDDDEAEFRVRCAGSERILLLETIRAIDSIGYLRAFAPDRALSELPGYSEMSWLGASRAISSFLPTGMAGQGADWSPTNPELSQWASYRLYQSGLVSHLKRLTDLSKYGLADLKLSDDGAIRFVLTADDAEAIDRDAIEWFGRHVGAVQRPLLDALQADRGAWVAEQLRARVVKTKYSASGILRAGSWRNTSKSLPRFACKAFPAPIVYRTIARLDLSPTANIATP